MPSIPQLCSDQPGAICCESFWAIAQKLSIVAGQAIRECFGDVCPGFPYYVCHGEPIGGGDYVAVWLSGGAPGALNQQNMRFVQPYRLTYTVCLSMEGYPMPAVQQGQMTPIPSPAEHNRASYFTYGAAERMYRAVVNAIVVDPNSVLGACGVRTIGNLTFQQPALWSARWMFQVSVDVS